jgi:16S rRNA (guanine527-N7)-methyltransferase
MGLGAATSRLNALLEQAGLASLENETAAKFETYLSLILRWNARLNLTSLRTEDSIISNHLAESLVCAMAVPSDVKTLLDFGSGAGLPGIPIALCRPEISVTLAESQNKKAAFVQEAIRKLGIAAKVHPGRAETLEAVFDCVTLRAVDRMPQAVRAAANLVARRGWLALMTTNSGLAVLQSAAGDEFSWPRQVPLSVLTDRIVAFGRRQAAKQSR